MPFAVNRRERGALPDDRRAARPSPREFPPGALMNRQRFEKLVEEALAGLPAVFREKLKNVVIVVEDRPRKGDDLEGLLLGLYHGTPQTERGATEARLPDRIVLYQRNLEAMATSPRDLRREVRRTLLHELGHYFGLSEEELEDV